MWNPEINGANKQYRKKNIIIIYLYLPLPVFKTK